jgi:hypothetical protein
MSWVSEHKNAWRITVLVLLVVAMVGPWTYSSDGVPPAEWCDDPLILLENGRCVKLVSGATVLAFWATAFFQMGVDLTAGETVLGGRASEFLFAFFFMVGTFLVVLPFFSTLLQVLGRGRRRMRVFHVITWGLAAPLALLLAVLLVSGGPYAKLWGAWLYVALTAIALTLELLALAGESRPAPTLAGGNGAVGAEW